MKTNQILILNAGSSSIKFSIFELATSLERTFDGEVSGIGTPEADLIFHRLGQPDSGQIRKRIRVDRLQTFHEAVGIISELAAKLDNINFIAIGHRVVHSGPVLKQHQKITPQVLEQIKSSIPFAPLHQPLAIEMIESARAHFQGVENYACFDTLFHQSLPEAAFTYCLPKALRDLGLRRYGFHGLSCESVIERFKNGFATATGTNYEIPSRLIIAHIGNGASVTAVVDGCSVDTTMGFTPCGGVVMGTRSGDLDPGVIFRLLRLESGPEHLRVDSVEAMLNTESGLKAIFGLSHDMRELRKATGAQRSLAALAIEIFTREIKKAIGAYVALMGSIDAIVFTGGIGEHDIGIREEICKGLGVFGVKVNEDRNQALSPDARVISDEGISPKLYVFTADENRVIAEHVCRLTSYSRPVVERSSGKV